MSTKIIIHCSASPWGTAIEIDKWHRERGWSGIGYHDVVLNGFPDPSYWDEDESRARRIKIYNGAISPGRRMDSDDDIESWESGAHAYGYNRTSVGICLIGGEYRDRYGQTKMARFSKLQIISLVKVIKLRQFQFRVSTENVVGHCELPGVQKSCPNLPMDKIRSLVDNKTDSIRLFKSFDLVKEVY